jgi:hypothetical protein
MEMTVSAIAQRVRALEGGFGALVEKVEAIEASELERKRMKAEKMARYREKLAKGKP